MMICVIVNSGKGKNKLKKQLCQLHEIGLEPISLKLQSGNQEVSVSLSESTISTRTEVKEDRNKLSPEILHLLLRFSISQESYHEMAMHSSDLPGLYQVRMLFDVNLTKLVCMHACIH